MVEEIIKRCNLLHLKKRKILLGKDSNKNLDLILNNKNISEEILKKMNCIIQYYVIQIDEIDREYPAYLCNESGEALHFENRENYRNKIREIAELLKVTLIS